MYNAIPQIDINVAKSRNVLFFLFINSLVHYKIKNLKW